MRIILVRHALAAEREEFIKKNIEDHLRPITPKGRKKMQKIATTFSELIGDVDFIISSPYLRARETADVLSAVFTDSQIREAAELVPHSPPQSLLKWLRTFPEDFNTMIMVGHEPHLSLFASFLLTGEARSVIDLKKSGMICFEIDSLKELSERHVILKWMVHPKMVD